MDQHSSTQTQIDVTKVFLLLLAILLIGGSMTVAFFYYNQYQKTQALLKDPTKANQEQNKDLIGRVGKLIDLPAETPTVATVIDKTKLASQPFFQRAQNQDRVLIFTQAKKAILYRPSSNKIIEVAPITIGNNNQDNSNTTKQEQVAGASTTNVTPTGTGTFNPIPTPTFRLLPTSTPRPSGGP